MKGFVFAGERSGDSQGAHIIQELSPYYPNLEIFGVGGPKLKESGLKPTVPFDTFEVMGFFDVFLALPRLWKAFRTIERTILKENPDFVLLIDSPAFCLKLEKSLRKKGYKGKIIHHVCPSIWIWKKGRKKVLEKNVDLLTCLFAFEKDLFNNSSLEALFVGHPLCEEKMAFLPNSSWEKAYNIPSKKPIIAIFPGSRNTEIKRNLPYQIALFKAFQKKHPEFQAVISLCRKLPKQLEPLLQYSSIFTVDANANHDLMHSATLAIATSGTITLELGLFGVPSIITYKIGFIDYLIVKYLLRIRIPFIGLSNILLNKGLFPEILGRTLSLEKGLISLEESYDKREFISRELEKLSLEVYNKKGFAKSVAEAILSLFKKD